MARSLCIVILIAFSIVASSAIDCNYKGCSLDGHQHTMCKYPNPEPAKACGKVLSVGLSNDEKIEILNAHNKHRSYVAQGLELRGNPGPQPPALNMQTMVWDDELAEIVQRWMNQCELAYDEWRDVDRFWVGQILVMWSTTGGVNWKLSNLIDILYNEVEHMDRNQVSRFTNGTGVTQYVQLVWANSVKLGCGRIVYQPNSTDWKMYYIGCNYGPGGRIFGEPIYLIKE